MDKGVPGRVGRGSGVLSGRPERLMKTQRLNAKENSDALH
jgi:hypothetical protein